MIIRFTSVPLIGAETDVHLKERRNLTSQLCKAGRFQISHPAETLRYNPQYDVF